MNRERIMKMDSYMLLSLINTKLRDEFSSLNNLCDDFEVSVREIQDKMKSVGYEYNSQTNQFIAV